MALVVRPRILLLDEPTSGVSAEDKFALMEVVLGAVRAEKVTVLFVEHDMEIVRRYAERVLAFYEGRILADGRPDAVLDDPDVRRYVVGGPAAAERASREDAC
jgi:branched-chain amino acid transport system ATP-binding protein